MKILTNKDALQVLKLVSLVIRRIKECVNILLTNTFVLACDSALKRSMLKSPAIRQLALQLDVLSTGLK